MVSVSCLKVVFCESDVRFKSVMEAVSVKWACVLLSAVACFAASCVVCGFIGVYGWIQNAFVVIVDNLFCLQACRDKSLFFLFFSYFSIYFALL